MTTAQRIIKYLAIALAIFIIVNIISMIVFGIYIFSNVLGLRNNEKTSHLNSNRESVTTSFNNSDIEILKIELKSANLTIKQGDSLKVQSTNKDIKCEQKRNQLKIEEKNHNWFSENVQEELILYIPESVKLDEVEIEAGAGQINIDTLYTTKLSLEVGAGKVEIQNLEVTKKAKVEGGAGKVDISASTINNLDLDMGVGKFSLSTKLIGNNQINAGIGQLDIHLTDNEKNYKIRANKGIGTIKINEKEISNDEIYGNGNNFIKIDGGIGSINVNTEK